MPLTFALDRFSLRSKMVKWSVSMRSHALFPRNIAGPTYLKLSMVLYDDATEYSRFNIVFKLRNMKFTLYDIHNLVTDANTPPHIIPNVKHVHYLQMRGSETRLVGYSSCDIKFRDFVIFGEINTFMRKYFPVIILPSPQNFLHSADGIYECICVNENICLLIKTVFVVLNGPIHNNKAIISLNNVLFPERRHAITKTNGDSVHCWKYTFAGLNVMCSHLMYTWWIFEKHLYHVKTIKNINSFPGLSTIYNALKH